MLEDDHDKSIVHQCKNSPFFTFLKAHYGTELGDYLPEMLSGFARDANTIEEVEELTEWLADNRADVSESIEAIASDLDNAQINIVWMQRFSEEVVLWLNDNAGTNSNQNGVAAIASTVALTLAATACALIFLEIV